MRIVLATGIYPPDIGGPATYVYHLARELRTKVESVKVITYGSAEGARGDEEPRGRLQSTVTIEVIRVPKGGGPLLRWWRYRNALRLHASDADIVYAFSSVSVGVPLWLAKLQKPKKILRLGGDFFWERYTDHGGRLPLEDWYKRDSRSKQWMRKLLKTFDHIVFSSRFQRRIYETAYKDLPARTTIENAVPAVRPTLHQQHEPLRLLFIGRFVGFKNLPSLLQALATIPSMVLTLAGEGPMERRLRRLTRQLKLSDRVTFHRPVFGDEVYKLMAEHDLFVLPSLTEISPNIALEARAAGMPVLVTFELGLSVEISQGMFLEDLREPGDISTALLHTKNDFDALAEKSALPFVDRPWVKVTQEHVDLFRTLAP